MKFPWATRPLRNLEHSGSAHDDAELEALTAAARQRLAAGQMELDLGLGGPFRHRAVLGVSHQDHAVVPGAVPESPEPCGPSTGPGRIACSCASAGPGGWSGDIVLAARVVGHEASD
jgi:hypothetical protein